MSEATGARGSAVLTGHWVWGLTLLTLLTSGGAQANLRAPQRVWAGPSAALSPAAGVEVQSERLSFVCDGAGEVCEVEATYVLKAEAAVALGLSFILPVEAPVSVRVAASGGATAPVEVQASAAEALSAQEQEAFEFDLRNGVPLFRARFQVAVEAGLNEVIITYPQALAAEEHDYGYFKDGVMVPEINYHLWPITEWQSAPTFTLALNIRQPSPEPSWWQRLWGSEPYIACWSLEGLDGVTFNLSQEGGQLVYQAQSPLAALPSVLQCGLGPRDILGR